MSYDISALPAYIDQTGQLLRKSVFGAKTSSIIGKLPGVKGSKSVNIFDDSTTFQAGTCGFNAIDDTPLSQRILTVGSIKINKKFCPEDLDGVYAQYLLKPGSYQTEIPFEQELLSLISDTVSAELETALWQADKNSGNANLNKFDGLIKIITDAGSEVVTGVTAVDSEHILETMDAVYAAIPVSILSKPDVRILIGFDTFRTFTTALKNANLYHYGADATDFEIVLPGTNIKIVALNGLNGTNAIVAARLSNLIYGFDVEKDVAEAKIFYAVEADEVRVVIKFKAGTQVAFPAEIVYFS